MAYSGSTAASSISNVPLRVVQGPLAGPLRINRGTTAESTSVFLGNSMWWFRSTDSSTLAQAANYFTDAKSLGMQQNDIVFVTAQTSVGATPTLLIGLLSSVTTAGAYLSTASMISSTFG